MWFSPVHRMQIVCEMSRVLQAVDDLDNAEHRTTAYTYIGVPTEQIIEHDAEATNNERLRRSIYNLKQRSAA